MKRTILIQTFVTRFLVLILSFFLVMYSTNMWGSEGKGIISIIIANSAIVGFFSNVFAGSSVSYFSSHHKTENVLLYAYIWSILVGLLVPIIFSFIFFKTTYLFYIISLSILFSLLSANINLFIGRQDIRKFNNYTILQQSIHILFILLLVYAFRVTNVETYFIAQIACYGILFIISFYEIFQNCKISNFAFSKDVFLSMFEYGWKSQLSAFVQFLNYRLSFYFLEFYVGIAQVGIFSVGITFSEAIWTVSRSLSVILYADVLKSENSEDAILKTKSSLKISFVVSFLLLIFVLLIPNQFYILIFGKDFSQTKQIVLLLSPGILAIAVSNIIGFYFAGTNRLRILNTKSILGFLVTITCSMIAIPRYGILGACVVSTFSYCVSSGILFWRFYKITEFKFQDFLISKTELSLIINKIFSK